MALRSRLVIVGDSVAAGYGLPAGSSACTWPALVDQRLRAAQLEVELRVSALEGADTRYALRRFERLVTRHEPDHVLLALGLNDAHPPGERTAISPAEYQQNLFALVDRVLSIGALPLVASVTPRRLTSGPETNWSDLVEPYVAAAHELARGCGLPWIDVFGRFLEQRDLWALIPDGTHPAAEGHRLLAETLAPPLVDLLRSGAAAELCGPNRAAPSRTAEHRLYRSRCQT